ncbi:F-box domain-containing protein [Mycena indigotica]|uniref:F-box domain-containing protein n=1 Tax=Mycena indigotica TaxID=2126181 RepID=A0A8H6VUV7_9AGAR|nr:F-box domain-containing protein [Mycena indigotica]KAF7292816.1 F-box domain-containing protein [Mycena indigotica]
MSSAHSLKTLLSFYLRKLCRFFLDLFMSSGKSFDDSVRPTEKRHVLVVISEPVLHPTFCLTVIPPPPPVDERESQSTMPSTPSLTFTKPRNAPRPPHKSPARARQRQHFGNPVIEHVVHPRSLMPLEPIINLPAVMVHKLLQEIELSRERLHDSKKHFVVDRQLPSTHAPKNEKLSCALAAFSFSKRKVNKRHSLSCSRDTFFAIIPASHSSPALLRPCNVGSRIRNDAEGLLTAVMQEAENTATAIDAEAAEAEDYPSSRLTITLVSSISASRSMAELSSASSRSISDLLNAFDQVMVSPSWCRIMVRSEDIKRRRMDVEALV